jgi:FtsP/CotA-like multicopper oxidase with cupredoxin domain
VTFLKQIGRRRFIGMLGGTALMGAVPGAVQSAQSAAIATGAFTPDLEIELRAVPDQIPLYRGAPTHVWRYRAKVIKGDERAVSHQPGSPLGPVIRVHRGTRVRIHFINEVSQPSVVHWHGLLVPEAADGHPRFAVGPGGRYVYEFEVINRAGTYWFHPHPHGMTGSQVYAGLTGLFIVSDDEEQALGLPAGERDVSLVIQDRSFTRDNELRYIGNGPGMMGMMSSMTGFLGDRIHVNGRPDYMLTAERRPYRLRLVNGSNSRIYKLAWYDGTPLTVIGTDGGLLAAPVNRPYVTLAPSERIELWVDFSSRAAGEELNLVSLPFVASSGGGMMGQGMMGGGPAQGSALPVLKVRMGQGAAVSEKLPGKLASIPALHPEQAHNLNNPRPIRVTASGMRWSLNGRLFEMEGVARDEVVRFGSTEVWEFINEAGMGMMGSMPHPMHVHGVQFRVIDRRVHPSAMAAWRSVSEGYVDEGWKDTALVMPGERVRALMRFEHYPGLFLYHCHNLEHEDMGMMRNYLIKA